MSALGLFEKSTYREGNRMIYSKVRTHENNRACNSHFSIKYVVEGIEQYQLNNVHYRVNKGEYILVNPGNVHREQVDSSNEVTGICISLTTEVLHDVYRNLIISSGGLLDNPVAQLRYPLDLYETLYPTNACVLGDLMQQLSPKASVSGPEIVDTFGFYSQVAQRLLESQGIVQQKICTIQAEKYTTQKELYRRIEIGRYFIAENYARPLEIEDIAAAAAMSSFHFSRTFKQVLKVSPYQYVLSKRLQKAKDLLKGKKESISEIAYLTGFPDIFTFSKSFKTAFQITPSRFRSLS